MIVNNNNKTTFKFDVTNNVEHITTIDTCMFEETVNYQGNKWVNYGKDNLYPEYLWGLYLNSSTHSAIVEQKVDYICGEGFLSGDRKKFKTLKKIVFDYVLYGGFAIQLIYNALGEIDKIQVLDFSRVRVNSDLTKCYYSQQWKKSGGKDIQEFDLYDPNNKVKYDENGEEIVKFVEVYYFRGDKTRSVYPIPSYVGSTQSIETSIEIQNYHNKAIKNNFNGSAIINVVGDPTDEEKSEFIKGINENMVGSDKAANYLVIYNSTKDEQTTITRLESDKSDERYKELSVNVRENIFIGHRIISSSLIGLPTESTGFNTIEYQDIFKLFNKTVIEPIQQLILESLSDIYPDEDEIIPFKIPFDTNV